MGITDTVKGWGHSAKNLGSVVSTIVESAVPVGKEAFNNPQGANAYIQQHSHLSNDPSFEKQTSLSEGLNKARVNPHLPPVEVSEVNLCNELCVSTYQQEGAKHFKEQHPDYQVTELRSHGVLQGLVAVKNNEATVAFAGTKDGNDVSTNAELGQVPLDGTNSKVRVHGGYLDHYRELAPQIAAALPPNALVTFTGHSMGGPVATVATLEYERKTGKPPSALVTFAGPRAVNDEGAAQIEKTTRLAPIIGDDDPVAGLVFSKHKTGEYRQPGKPVMVNDKGEVFVGPKDKGGDVAHTVAALAKMAHDGTGTHLIEHYHEMLKTAQKSDTERMDDAKTTAVASTKATMRFNKSDVEGAIDQALSSGTMMGAGKLAHNSASK